MAEFRQLVPTYKIAALALPVLIAACSPTAGEPDAGSASTPPRAGRFGSLRDFVLVRVPAAGGGQLVLFVDRFEVTRADWAGFAATPAGAAVAADSAAMLGDGALPVGRVSLRQARAFARWRFARLPRFAEWDGVVRGFPRHQYPWGIKPDANRANTSELGLGEPTLVGTFESGRRAIGQPYDLIGNVSEWTETVPVEWCLDERAGNGSLSLLYAAGLTDARRLPALSLWQSWPAVLPGFLAVMARSPSVPRQVVGADFQSSMVDTNDFSRRAPPEAVLGGDRRLRTGARLVTTPTELLAALVAAEVEPTATDYEQLARFVRRSDHGQVLRRAWGEVLPRLPPARLAGALGQWLAERLGP